MSDIHVTPYRLIGVWFVAALISYFFAQIWEGEDRTVIHFSGVAAMMGTIIFGHWKAQARLTDYLKTNHQSRLEMMANGGFYGKLTSFYLNDEDLGDSKVRVLKRNYRYVFISSIALMVPSLALPVMWAYRT